MLVDTPVWIGVFRRRSRIRFDSVVDVDEIVTCLPMVQERLSGFVDERRV